MKGKDLPSRKTWPFQGIVPLTLCKSQATCYKTSYCLEDKFTNHTFEKKNLHVVKGTNYWYTGQLGWNSKALGWVKHKPISKDYILYYFICMTFSKDRTTSHGGQSSGCQGQEFSKLFSRVAVQYCIPVSSVWECQLSYIPTTIWYCRCSGLKKKNQPF